MSHATACMARMEHPSKNLGQIIARIENPCEMFHDNVAFLAPFLNGKVLDLDVTSTRCGTVFVDHRFCSLIVDVQQGWCRGQSIKFKEDISKVFCNLTTGHAQVELCFSRTGSNEWLNTALPCNSSTAKEEDKSSDRSTHLEISSMSRIKGTNQLVTKKDREWWQVRIFIKEIELDMGKIVEGKRALVNDTP